MAEREERGETYISVDVETAGPTPSAFAMLSIGACLVDSDDVNFYVELKPDKTATVDSAMAIGGLSMSALEANGEDPAAAMSAFEQWVTSVVPEGNIAVFVGFNAVFDWMFVADYFQRYLGRNPFGHSAIDIKSLYMGAVGTTWARTSLKYLSPLYLDGSKLSHNALGDAKVQAEVFRAVRAESARR
jgi:DNA polymerase III epsilon subunit-like protein